MACVEQTAPHVVGRFAFPYSSYLRSQNSQNYAKITSVMASKLPTVAIIGRANAGKSSLFNRFVKTKQAIVAKEAGTTRDSVLGRVTYGDHNFWLVDTAGLKDPNDEFEASIQDQITEAADAADVILVVVDSTEYVGDEDRIWPLHMEANVKPHETFQLPQRVLHRWIRLPSLHQLTHVALHQAEQQALLVRRIVIKRPGLHPDLCRDLAHRHGGVAMLCKQPQRRRLNARAGDIGV